MSVKINSISRLGVVRCLAVIAFLAIFAAPVQAFEIEIDVAPATLNLQNQGQCVTVHTDIAFGEVDVHSVFINGIAIDSWKADNQGNFVAKFLINEIKNLPLNIGDYNTLTLIGNTVYNEAFSGSQDIMVINVIPKGR